MGSSYFRLLRSVCIPLFLLVALNGHDFFAVRTFNFHDRLCLTHKVKNPFFANGAFYGFLHCRSSCILFPRSKSNTSRILNSINMLISFLAYIGAKKMFLPAIFRSPLRLGGFWLLARRLQKTSPVPSPRNQGILPHCDCKARPRPSQIQFRWLFAERRFSASE